MIEMLSLVFFGLIVYTFLVIVPLVIMYAFTQKWFVEGIDKSGITGE